MSFSTIKNYVHKKSNKKVERYSFSNQHPCHFVSKVLQSNNWLDDDIAINQLEVSGQERNVISTNSTMSYFVFMVYYF